MRRAWTLAALGLAACPGWGCIDVPERSEVAGEVDGDAAETPVDVDGRRPMWTDRGVDRGATPLDARPRPHDATHPLDATPPVVDLDVDPDAAIADATFMCPLGEVAVPAFGLCLAFERCAPIPEPRAGHRLARLGDGRVLLVGGTRRGPEGSDLGRTTYLFDPTPGTWADAGDLEGGRHRQPLVALPDGRAMLAGGDDSEGSPVGSAQSETYIFDPTAFDRGQPPWRLHQRIANRARYDALWYRGAVWAVGGLSGDDEQSDDDFVDTQVWTEQSGWRGADDGAPRIYDHRLIALDDRVVLVGGRRFDEAARVTGDNRRVYALDGERWSVAAEDVPHVSGPAVGTPAGVLLVGGVRSGPDASLRRLTAQGVVGIGEMAVVRTEPAAAQIADSSRVLIIGGEVVDTPAVTLDVVDVTYGRRADVAVMHPALVGAWRAAQAVTLLDGGVMLAGGWIDNAPTDRCARVHITR